MSAGTTAVSDVIVPSVFGPYVQQKTAEKSNVIQSGVAMQDPELDNFLNGGGLTFNRPSFKDLDTGDADLVSGDTSADSTPNKIGTSDEVVVRLSRNNSWATADLASQLAGDDPAMAIADKVADYWMRRQQAALIATLTGVFLNNASATDAYHVQNDMTKDVSGGSFVDGTTNFTAGAFIDACTTMGDNFSDLKAIFVHSVVFARMQKLNLIVNYPSQSDSKIEIPYYLGRRVIIDDAMPNSGGIFDSWILGESAVGLGWGQPKVPVEVFRKPAAGNGGGQDVLFSRVEWVVAPTGYAYVGTPPAGGPSNAATTNNLGAAASWQRVYPQRKQIKIARLKTREY